MSGKAVHGIPSGGMMVVSNGQEQLQCTAGSTGNCTANRNLGNSIHNHVLERPPPVPTLPIRIACGFNADCLRIASSNS